MSKNFPPGLQYNIGYDTTPFVREAISKVYETLFIAGILVLIVILLFLQNFRAMLVPATTVPVTIIGAFIAIAALGFTVNLMTLFALLAIGIVVDDAIVIVEGASYYIEKGLTPRDATIKAMSELTGPVMGITLALISVFLPAAFFPGITGQIFRQFALVIAATAVISAMNALTLKPVQCAFWLRPHDKQHRPNWLFRGFNRFFQWGTDVYMVAVEFMVGRPVMMLIVFIIIINISFYYFLRRPTGFLPTEDQGYGVLFARLPEGSSLPRNREVAKKITDILKRTRGVKTWVTVGDRPWGSTPRFTRRRRAGGAGAAACGE